jgi:hypothetical protein
MQDDERKDKHAMTSSARSEVALMDASLCIVVGEGIGHRAVRGFFGGSFAPAGDA